MNKVRRNALMKLQDIINTAVEYLELLLEEEEEARDNIPESLQNSERYERADAACDAIQSEWISVEERLPEDYNKYLLFLDNGRITIGWYHEGAMKFVEDGIVIINIVTHWMPLPEAPKMKGGAEQ